jgi:hypothetical protein
MSISRFDNPAEQQLIDQYIPLPFSELSNSLQKKQAELDQVKEQEFQLRNLAASLKADPLTNQYLLPEVMNEYTLKLNELSEKIAKGDDVGYKQEVGRIARQWTNDPRVKAIRNSREQFEKYQPDLQKAQKDRNYRNYYDKYQNDFAKSIEKYKTEGGDFPTFNYDGMKVAQDYVEPGGKLMNNIAAELESSEGYKRYPKGHPQAGQLIINELGQYTKNGKSWEYIDQNKIKNVARKNTTAFLSGDGGESFIDEILNNDPNIQNIPSEKRAEYITDIATNFLADLGYKQGFTKEKSSQDLQNLSEFQLKSLGLGEDEATFNRYEINTPSTKTPTEALNRGLTTISINGKEVKTGIPEESKSTKFWENLTSGPYPFSVNNVGKAVQSLFVSTDSGETLDQTKLNSEDKRLVDIVTKKYGLWNPTKKEITDAIVEYGKETSNKSQSSKINILNDIAIANDKRFDQSNDEFNKIMFSPDKDGIVTLNGAIANLKVINASTGETLEGKELVGKVSNTVGALNNNNPYGPGWRQVQADGETYYIPGSDQEVAKNEQEWSFHQVNYNLLGKTTVPTSVGNIEVIKDDIYKGKNIIGSNYSFVDPRSGEEVEIRNVPNSQIGYQYFLQALK